ncbi:MAG TPA: hypothetical protein VE987_00610 [Polyangiaceae bacterium]|nr:hypothetical protein [Polyangiaceae bacterium]
MTTLTIRLDAPELERLDAISEVLAERAGGGRITRAAALRAVVEAGLDVLDAHFRQSGSKLKR